MKGGKMLFFAGMFLGSCITVLIMSIFMMNGEDE